MRFSQSFLDQIRERIPISDVIGRRVTWDRKKTNTGKGDYWACCPFHGEKTPSFHCENQKGRYHCFGCGVSGDHFRFLVELEGLSFPEAVEQLAEEAGLPLPVADPRLIEREKARASLYDVMAMAARYFADQLQTADGARARAYLRDRGLPQKVQQEFGLGYAPNSRNALKTYLASKDIPKDQIEACGLVVFGDDIAVSYDRFRDRIMFPIEDTRGRVIAFGGRALSADVQAKYLNSPETELFHKGHVLYNAARARKPVQQAKSVIVTEGYMDVIALHAAGIENAVAPLGTALTDSQLDMLWRMTPEPVLCFDGDAAGQRAANRCVDLALPKLVSGRSLRFCLLPEGQDPDDVVSTGGREAFEKLLDDAIPLHELFIVRRRNEMSIEAPQEKAALERQIYADANSIQDEIVRKYYRSHVRLRLANMFKMETDGVSRKRAAELYKEELEQRPIRTILGFCVEYPMLIENNVEKISNLKIKSQVYREFVQSLHELYIEYGDLAVSEIYDKLSDRFYFILNSIHGEQGKKTIKDASGNVVGSIPVVRGHQLHQIFPMVRYEPPPKIAQQTLDLMFLRIELINIEAEAQTITEYASVEQFEGFQTELLQARERYEQAERELDQSYHHWAGRPWMGDPFVMSSSTAA